MARACARRRCRQASRNASPRSARWGLSSRRVRFDAWQAVRMRARACGQRRRHRVQPVALGRCRAQLVRSSAQQPLEADAVAPGRVQQLVVQVAYSVNSRGTPRRTASPQEGQVHLEVEHQLQAFVAAVCEQLVGQPPSGARHLPLAVEEFVHSLDRHADPRFGDVRNRGRSHGVITSRRVDGKDLVRRGTAEGWCRRPTSCGCNQFLLICSEDLRGRVPSRHEGTATARSV